MLKQVQSKSLLGLALCFLLFILSPLAHAQKDEFEEQDGEELEAEVPRPKGTSKPQIHDPNYGWEQTFIERNIEVSEMFDSLAEGLDLFLVGKRITKKQNETSVRIENSTISTEEENIRNVTNLAVNLRLPNLEEYWQLKFTSYDEKEEKRNVRRSYLRQTTRETNYGATVGLFRKFGSVRTMFTPRIELQDPLRVSHSLTFESVAEMKSFHVNPKLELFATPDKGPGVFYSLNFNFYLTDVYSFLFLNEGEYEEERNRLSTNNGFSLGQGISETSSLAYSIFFHGLNRENYHLESYNISVGWSQVLYKKILDYQIIPNINFARDKSFKGVAGIVFNVNLNY